MYPHHGAAVIEGIATRIIGGAEREHLRLRVAQADLTIQTPSKNVEMVGVRDAVDKESLEHIFETLQTTKTEGSSNWSCRYKTNVEKITISDVVKAAGVVHDLSHRDSKKGLSAGGKRMLSKTRQALVSKFALAEKTNKEDASNRLDEVLVS